MPDSPSTAGARAWLARFAQALELGNAEAVLAAFAEDCFWRDLVTFTWNVITLEGPAAIAGMLAQNLSAVAPERFALSGEAEQADGVIEAWFTFETAVARGIGHMRLIEGRCRTLLTAITELKGFEEQQGASRPLGVRHGADCNRRTWTDRRRADEAELGFSRQPYVLIIGGGQGGMALGARLKQLGVPTLILEKNGRPGDSWRNRYRSLVLHDPVWYDHLPYMPFPQHWPVFTPKDKMGDWLEMYARVMELDYWCSAEARAAQYDPVEKVWTVTVDRNGEAVTLRPKQLVFATGAYGPPKMIRFPGAENFGGEIIHSSRYSDGARYRGRKVAVIGAASSAHDVAVDLWEAGAEVTMVQRSPTTVVRSETLMALAFDLYSEAAAARGISVDKADLIGAATPFALQPQVQRSLYDRIRSRDAEFYKRLQATGFLLDFGEDETGLMMKAYRTGSGYYVDVGASQLIIDGEIRVKSGVEIARLEPNAIRFADGTVLAADAIIQSTGFQSMHETVARIASREMADAVGPCWGLGSGVRHDPGPWQGELRNMYKPTAQEGLWFHGGNLALSRFFSKVLALQLKARMEGLPTPVFGAPEPL